MFSTEIQKRSRPRWEGRRKGAERSRGRGNHIPYILGKKKIFSIKGKNPTKFDTEIMHLKKR